MFKIGFETLIYFMFDSHTIEELSSSMQKATVQQIYLYLNHLVTKYRALDKINLV